MYRNNLGDKTGHMMGADVFSNVTAVSGNTAPSQKYEHDVHTPKT